jgi:hypothetical protein
MSGRKSRFLPPAAFLAAVVLLAPPPLQALSHLWKIHEVFSSADGKVQFIELKECCGSTEERYLDGLEFTCETTGKVFTFSRDLTGSTSQRFLLLGTADFAALPGAPAPDFIIPEVFFAIGGDKLWYSEERNYDSFTFGPDKLPVDGIHSIQVTDAARDLFTTGPNSPTNYAGQTGAVDVSRRTFTRGDCNVDTRFDIADAVFLLAYLFESGENIPCQDGCDANDDGSIDVSDAVKCLLVLFNSSGPIPAPQACDTDPTIDGLDCASFEACT